jgi:hypothetical protein
MSETCKHGRIRCAECVYVEELEERVLFNDEELEVIRELLSAISCGYDRKTWYFGCCEANPIIEKIDAYFTKQKDDANE